MVHFFHIWFDWHPHDVNSWNSVTCWEELNSATTGQQKAPKQKLLSGRRPSEGQQGSSNIAETMVMLPSHLLYFPCAGKALPHICTASAALWATFKAEEPRNKAQSEDMEANLEMEN